MELHYAFTTVPTQYLFCDFPFKAEYFIGRYSVGVILGFKPATQSSGSGGFWSGMPGFYIDRNMFNSLYNSYTAGISGKRYTRKNGNSFVEAELLYRHYWFDNKPCSFTFLEKSYSFNGIRTERQDVYVAKLLLGTTRIRYSTQKSKKIIETFAGISYRYKTYRLETRDGVLNGNPVTYDVEEGSTRESHREVTASWPVVLQLGWRVGIGR